MKSWVVSTWWINIYVHVLVCVCIHTYIYIGTWFVVCDLVWNLLYGFAFSFASVCNTFNEAYFRALGGHWLKRAINNECRLQRLTDESYHKFYLHHHKYRDHLFSWWKDYLFFCSTEVDVSVMNPRSVKTLVSIIAYIEFRIEMYLQCFLFLMPQGRKQ